MSASRSCYCFNAAIVRQPSPTVVNGLRAKNNGDPDYSGVRQAHAAYVAAMETAGVVVTALPALEAYPDSIFVEDPALVFTEGAVLLRPGSPTREGEAQALAATFRLSQCPG